jgi:Putative peptidoglycan binding domain/Protein-glutamine gamma-glutamyltransferase
VRDVADGGGGHPVLSLQRQAGNRATTILIQRSPGGGAIAAAPTASHPRLARGSRGQGVRKLQQRLNVLGAEPPLKVDGVFGAVTKQAVVEFQRAHFPDDETQWDGKVGTHTWEAIDEAYQPPEIDADEDALGEHVKEKMDQMNNQPATADSGVHYHYNYRADHPDRYKPDMATGYADPSLLDKEGHMTWRVKPKTSASAAIQSWLRGLTVAECYTAMIVAEYDAVRAAVGDEKFDETFGSTDRVMPKEKRLLIRPWSENAKSQVEGLLKRTDASTSGASGSENDRPAKVGEWYYFMNHPKYLLKHPGGAWQGENAIYVGREGTANEQMWSGLGTSRGTGPGGASHVTERQMLEEMVEAYNADRNVDDTEALKRIKRANKGVLPAALVDGFPPTLSGPDEILKAPPEALDVPGFLTDKSPRVPGFNAQAGVKLDADAIKAIRDS